MELVWKTSELLQGRLGTILILLLALLIVSQLCGLSVSVRTAVSVNVSCKGLVRILRRRKDSSGKPTKDSNND